MMKMISINSSSFRWYNVNTSMAKPWDWGRGQGCDFIFKSCGEFIKRQEYRQILIYHIFLFLV